MEDVENKNSVKVVSDKHLDLDGNVIKTKIVSELSSLESNTTFMASLLAPDIPQQPLVKVAGYGRVSLPVNDMTASALEGVYGSDCIWLGGETGGY